MSRHRRAADRLATGSAAVLRRLIASVQGWIARGRREDLDGWRAALGCWLRIALLGLGLYVLWRLIRAVPNVLWLLSVAWLAASWRAGRAALEDRHAPAGQPSREASAEAVRRLLLEVMGDASAVPLRTVLAYLQQQGQWEGRTVGDLRARIEALGIPVHPKVKAPGGGPTRGVRKTDLTPDQAPAEETSTEPSTAA
ncbi:hypothetical protein [Streptomyces sediminimaris]|uniref:hypothetical protein n=1 Tax=Streptomyces sediminimaris TaxID=3383721 RepID=UPI00399965D2